MKLTDKIAKRSSNTPFFTFEFFPPRTDQGFTNLLNRIARLSTLHPLAISVTWGAGGSTKSKSLELAGMSQEEFGVETILHITCTNMKVGSVEEALKDAKERGIQNILALRGDPPRGSEYWIPTDPRFTHAVDLVTYIRSQPDYADFFCVGVAAYPDGHPDAPSEDDEMSYLKAKVDAGADFIITQLFYDADSFKNWVERVRQRGITVPIIPGVMPIQNYQSFLRLTKLCGTNVPPRILEALQPIKTDDQKVKDYGVELATALIRELTSGPSPVQGIHFCTLNLEKSLRRVLDELKWTHDGMPAHNKVIEESNLDHLPPEVLITPADASTNARTALVHPPSSPSLREEDQLTAAKAEVNGVVNAWDEFTNGRFGDPSSPAYAMGSGDMWDPGAGGLGLSRPEALRQWGSPRSWKDLDDVFIRYLNSDPRTPMTPFSPEPLSSETATVLQYLLKLTSKGWWTVGSQPAADGLSSTDDVFGWGPAGGYVFQKPFVEFFCDEKTVESLRERTKASGAGLVTYFAADSKDTFVSNTNEEDRNAVTWGVFPGQEIVQSTIIERASFLAWKEEAFSIWSQWALLYPPTSEERQLLERVQDERWLVSIVHHDYKNPEALWGFLLDDPE